MRAQQTSGKLFCDQNCSRYALMHTCNATFEMDLHFCPQGGIHGKISLTAYVVAALLETGITTEVRTILETP